MDVFFGIMFILVAAILLVVMRYKAIHVKGYYRPTRWLLILALLAASFGVWSVSDAWSDDADAAVATTTTMTERPTTTTTTAATENLGLTDEEIEQLAKEVFGIYVGYVAGELDMGGNKPIPDSPEERSPTASFTKETIETREDLETFFASDHPKAEGARTRVVQCLSDKGYGDEAESAIASGERWIWIAPTVESQIEGTTYWLDGEIVKSTHKRQVAPNDAIWYYVTEDGHLVKCASVRADCGNPDVDRVTPVRPDTPEAPPIDIPPGEKCPFNPKLDVDSPFCLKPKDPSQDPNAPGSGALPEATGPGTTPVGTDPGDPRTPVDSPTGCDGACPTTTTSTTTAPGTGTTTTTSPPVTTPASGDPPNTGTVPPPPPPPP